MSLRRESWLAKAQALKLGGRKRTTHDCGPGTCMIVNHTEDGWSAYCFRCDDDGFVPAPRPTLQERQARRAAQQAAADEIEASPVPPMPADYDVAGWPLAARVWLFKAALFVSDIEALGIYYHAPTNRVVIPVFDDGQLVYWQARRIEGDGPKYLNPVVERGAILPRYGSGDCIVLTEDILSAVRCGMAAEGWSLMGVSLPQRTLTRIMQDGRPVIVWLDPDPAGQSAATDVMRTLQLTGIPCANIVSPKDPKLHSRAEVKHHIQEALQRARPEPTATAQAPQGVPASAPHGE